VTIIGYGFLLAFLPLSVLFYWSIPRKQQTRLWTLLTLSILFYVLADARALPVLIGLSVFTYFAASRRWLSAGILINLAVLVLFKLPSGTLSENSLLLPLGLSFFTFKHIGYLLDVGNKRIEHGNLLTFLTFSAFFPQISAGPISDFRDTGKQLDDLPASTDSSRIYTALTFISIGLAKKLVIADTIALSLDTTLYPQIDTGHGMIWAWMMVYLFALQIYFDFSGYTDIALGVGQLFGVKLPPNFNAPYLARNASQFWQRWHISLSVWFRIYLFTPMSRSLLKRWGRERSVQAQAAANLLTMALVGLWHGTGWGFVLWGVYHGVLLSLYAFADRRGMRWPQLPGVMFIAVLLGWALFLSPDLEFAGQFLGAMVGLDGIGNFVSVRALVDDLAVMAALVGTIITFSGKAEAATFPVRMTRGYAVGLGLLAALAVLHLDRSVNFLYVQF